MTAAAAQRIETDTIDVDGIEVFHRRLPGEGPPTVLFHGVPTHSEEWTPFLERMEGPALAIDLPGFGRSERPAPERFDSTMDSYTAFIVEALRALGVGEYSLVVHDWGTVGLLAAMREPERLRRVVMMNTAPLVPGYRWHRTARMWRTPRLGELSNRLWNRRLLALALRESRGDWSRPPDQFVDMIWEQLDSGTFESILRLYRSAPEEKLAAAGRGLADITAPALVIWAQKDRYLPGHFGADMARALPNAELVELPGLGHWFWLEEPTVIDRVVEFLEE